MIANDFSRIPFLVEVYKNLMSRKKAFTQTFDDEFRRSKEVLNPISLRGKLGMDIFSIELCKNEVHGLDLILNRVYEYVREKIDYYEFLFLITMHKLGEKIKREKSKTFGYCMNYLEKLTRKSRKNSKENQMNL